MRTAFYYPSAVPPREWLIRAALLWDHIYVSKSALSFFREFPRYAARNADVAMFVRIASEPGICATTPPLARDEPPSSQLTGYMAHTHKLKKGLEAMAPGFASGRRSTAKQKTASLTAIVDVSTAWNQVLLNRQFTAVFPDMDFFFADHRSFVSATDSQQRLFLASIQGIVPIASPRISIAQLKSFRADTAAQRRRYRELLESEISRFGRISSETEFVLALDQVKDVLREQLTMLEARCRQHKIDVVKRAFGLTLAAPALLQVLGSFLTVPVLQPAAAIAALSLVAADYLAAREKRDADLRAAPWAYLLSLKRNIRR